MLGKLFSRWYVIAPLVGAAMTAVVLIGGIALTLAGNAIGACQTGEIGCAGFYIIGLITAPAEFACATLLGGAVALRLARQGAPSPAQLWRACFGAGVLALFPAYCLGMAYLKWSH